MLEEDLTKFNEFFEAKKTACNLQIKLSDELHKENQET